MTHEAKNLRLRCLKFAKKWQCALGEEARSMFSRGYDRVVTWGTVSVALQRLCSFAVLPNQLFHGQVVLRQ